MTATDFIEYKGYHISVDYNTDAMKFYADVVDEWWLGSAETGFADTAEDAILLAENLIDDMLAGLR